MTKNSKTPEATAISDADLDTVQGGLGPGGLSHETTDKKTAGLRSDGELVQAVSETAHQGKASSAKNSQTAKGRANTIGVWDTVSS